MDRNELIKALGAAFSEEKDKSKDRLQIESAVAGEKSVLRVTEIHENSARFEMLRSHPEAYVVDNLVAELLESGEREAEIAGRNLQMKFDEAAKAKEYERINTIIRDSRELLTKLQSTRGSSPQRALVYMLVTDRISKM